MQHNNKNLIKKCTLLFVASLGVFNITEAAQKDINGRGYQRYNQRVDNICTQYKPKKVIFQTEHYEAINKSDGIKEAREIYKENMNNIYKCALLGKQLSALTETKELIKNNIDLQKRNKGKIENRIRKLKLQIKSVSTKKTTKCIDNESIQKLDVLKQTTYELCKYHSYLEYLRWYNSNIQNLIGVTIGNAEQETKYYTDAHIIQLIKSKNSAIDNAITHAYKIFPIAFDAYSQYELNLSIHLRLELVREAYIAYRKKLHHAIQPINQVVYKIANAMKK